MKPEKSTREKIEGLLKTNPTIKFAQAKQKLGNPPMSPTYFRKIQKEFKENMTTPKTAVLGATKQAIVSLLNEKGTKLTWAEAEPLLAQKGVKTSDNYFERIRKQYKKDSKKSPEKKAAKLSPVLKNKVILKSPSVVIGKPSANGNIANTVQQARLLLNMAGTKEEAIALLQIL
jgi:hypothetical protein